MAAIRVSHLVKRYPEKTAVDDISFEIGEGEFLVLVGPSGCGKTTTLRLLAGLEAPTSGGIYFGERCVNEIRPRDRNVAMVFQDYAVFPHMTVFENIAYGLRARHVPSKVIQERVSKAAATFRIDHLLRRKPRQLSGGERQRVALSRAMVRDADLYLYDEPLANLDAQLRHQAREDILTLHREKGKPSVYVTHDQSEAMAMGDRIAVMRAGKIEQIGTGAELYERPHNLFVAYFIGTPSINLFDVELVGENGGLWVRNQAFSLRLPPVLAERLHPYLGRTLKMGLRPEDLHVPRLAPFAVTEENQMKGVVNVIEPTATGCSVYLSTLEANPQDFVATFRTRLPAQYLGKEVPLAVHLEKAHFFHPETEQSLL
ncbi:MAG: ABC transporter ATP-binding protein [Anaerolineales bacterium]|nr:ABC transporter ATP-binding protein [Anaerolineales bacterium]MCX7609287.1 ABC transporter ATP-binding protein [Anaerolineales bacterium]MDW8227142.1 ABC transporter ATP-binding protein [Anaerolineales bacterium]